MKTHSTAIDLLRLSAMLGVVMIHLPICWTGGFFWFAFAVPMFAFLSGYFLQMGLNRDGVDWIKVLHSRFIRIVFPYVVWSFFYWTLNNVALDVLLRGKVFVCPSFTTTVDMFLWGGASAHLWFLPGLFYVSVVSLAAMRAIPFTQKSTRILFYVVLMVLGIFLTCILDEKATSAEFIGYVRLYLARIICFFSLGCIFSLLEPLHEKISSGVLLVRGGGMLATGIVFLKTGILTGVTLPWLLIVPGVFESVRAIEIKWGTGLSERWQVLIGNIGACSMGGYLIHLIFTSAVSVVGPYVGVRLPLSPLTGYIFGVAIWALSLAIVWSCRRFLKVGLLLG